jgi:hypothetical protein
MRFLSVVLITLSFAGCSRYDYTERRAAGMSQPVRVDRVSGETEVLTTHGWKPLVRPVTVTPKTELSSECAEYRRQNRKPNDPYADILADLPCSEKELASLAESQQQDSTRTQTLP